MGRKRSVMVTLGVLAAAAAGYFAMQSGDRDQVSTTTTTAAVTVTSPYDLTEATGDVDLSAVVDAKFASVSLVTPEGLTSYMVSADQEAFAALAAAVASAEEVEGAALSAASSLTFVMPDRVTMTFVLDVATGRIGRGGAVWRVLGNLGELVAAITDETVATPATSSE